MAPPEPVADSTAPATATAAAPASAPAPASVPAPAPAPSTDVADGGDGASGGANKDRRPMKPSKPVNASTRDNFFVHDTTNKTRLFDDIAHERVREGRAASTVRNQRLAEMQNREANAAQAQEELNGKEEDRATKSTWRGVGVGVAINNMRAKSEDPRKLGQLRRQLTEDVRAKVNAALASETPLDKKDVRMAYKEHATSLDARLIVRANTLNPSEFDEQTYQDVLQQAVEGVDDTGLLKYNPDEPLTAEMHDFYIQKQRRVDPEWRKNLGHWYDHADEESLQRMPPWERSCVEASAADQVLDRNTAGISSKGFDRLYAKQQKAPMKEAKQSNTKLVTLLHGGEEQQARHPDDMFNGRRFVKELPHKPGEITELIYGHDIDGSKCRGQEYDAFLQEERKENCFGATTKELQKSYVHQDKNGKNVIHDIPRRRNDVNNPLRLADVGPIVFNNGRKEDQPAEKNSRSNRERYAKGLKEQGYFGTVSVQDPGNTQERNKPAHGVKVENTAERIFQNRDNWMGRNGDSGQQKTPREQAGDTSRSAGQPSAAEQRPAVQGNRFYDKSQNSLYAAENPVSLELQGASRSQGDLERHNYVLQQEQDGKLCAGVPSSSQRHFERYRHRYASNPCFRPDDRTNDRTVSPRSARSGTPTPRRSKDMSDERSSAASSTPRQQTRRCHPDFARGYPTEGLAESRQLSKPDVRTLQGHVTGRNLYKNLAGLGSGEVRDQVYEPSKERHLGKRTFASAPSHSNTMFEGPRGHVPSAGTASWQDSMVNEREKQLSTFCARDAGVSGGKPSVRGLSAGGSKPSRSAADLLKEHQRSTRAERAAAAEIMGDPWGNRNSPRFNDGKGDEPLLFRGQQKLHPRDGDRGVGWNKNTNIDYAAKERGATARSASPRFNRDPYDWVQPRSGTPRLR